MITLAFLLRKGDCPLGVVVKFPDARRVRAAPRSWRAGDTGLCGANTVRIAALDGSRALVVGEASCGPWSIWMEASKLRPAEARGHAAPPTIRRMEKP